MNKVQNLNSVLAPSWNADLNVLIEKKMKNSRSYFEFFLIEERSKMRFRWDDKNHTMK